MVDDHVIFAEALRARLACESDLRRVTVAHSPDEARWQVLATRPTVAVLDLMLGDGRGIDLAAQIRDVSPQTGIVMLSVVRSVEAAVAALRRGARAWLPKAGDGESLVRVIRGVARGEAWLPPDLLGDVLEILVATGAAPAPPDPLAGLTTREREVLQHLADGHSRASIARNLGLSVHTVRTHIQNVLVKLGTHSTLESVAVALRCDASRRLRS